MCPDSLPSHVPQVLINREPLRHLNFDVELLGDCDVIANELCHRLGSHFSELCSTTSPANEITTDDVMLPVHSESDSSIPTIPANSASGLLATESAADDDDDDDNVPMVTVSVALPVTHSLKGPLPANELTTEEATLPVCSESDGSVPAIPTDSAADDDVDNDVPMATVSVALPVTHSLKGPLPASEITEEVTLPVCLESDGSVPVIPTDSESTLLVTERAAGGGDDVNVPMATVSAAVPASLSTTGPSLNSANDVIRTDARVDVVEDMGTASDSAIDNANVDGGSTVNAEPRREESIKTESVNWALLLKRKF